MAMPRSYEDWERVMKAAMGAELRQVEPPFSRMLDTAMQASVQAAKETLVFGDCRMELYTDPTLPPGTIGIKSGRDYVEIVNVEPEKPSFDRPGA